MDGMKKCWKLFWVFAQIGDHHIRRRLCHAVDSAAEVVEKRHWATEEELMDDYAIGQCTPGVIAINTATFIGYKLYGITGGIIATLGVIFPSLLIITSIAAFLLNFADLAIVKHAFDGIRACVTVLIFDAVIKLGKKALIDKTSWLLFFIVLVLSLLTSIPTVMLIVLSGIAGCLFSSKSASIKTRSKEQDPQDHAENDAKEDESWKH